MNSSIIKNFFIYSFGSIIHKCVAFFLLPLILNVLSPSDYGLNSLTQTFISILTALLGFGLRQVLYVEFFHYNNNERKKIINDIIILYVTLATPIFIGLSLITPLINRILFAGKASKEIILLALAICFFSFFVELYYQILRYTGKALLLTSTIIVTALLTISINVFLLCYLGWGVSGILIGSLTGFIIVFLKSLYSYFRYSYHNSINIPHSIKKARYYISMGLPFIPNILFAWILSSGDRWVLAHYTTMHHVGIYSIADIVTQLYNMVILYPMTGAYLPNLLEKFSKNKDTLLPIEQQNKKNMWFAMATMTILISVGYSIGKPIAYWMLPIKYHESIQYMWILLMGQIFLMGTYFATSIIIFHKRSYFLGFSLCIPALLNILLNILLVPHFSIYGCATATLFSYILYFIIVLWYNQNLLRKKN